MGRRKGQIAAMATLPLVKDRHRGPGRPAGHNSFLHTTELDDGTTYNRINFQSVTEQNNLEDFLTTAEMAGRDFTAERQAIQIIAHSGQNVRLTTDDLEKIHEAQTTHKASLQIPRRPAWDESTTKEELTLAERDSFTNWRRQLKMLEEEEHIQLTPYEKNLDFWRQLWRVIERSDVIVQIVDARNPLLFRCEDLETYVRQVDPRKTCMLLVNKADFLTQEQRKQWVEYFDKEGITAVFFSAKTEKEMQEELKANLCEITEEDSEEVSTDEDSEDDNEGDDDDDDDNDSTGVCDVCEKDRGTEKEAENSDRLGMSQAESLTTDGTASDVRESLKALNIGESDDPEKGQPKESSAESARQDQHLKAPPDNPELSENSPNTPSTEAGSSASATTGDASSTNSPSIVTSEELLEIFRSLAEPAAGDRGSEGVRTVGMVGYPNVGKSSTINVILDQKKLAVSATPGRTKHLQTLHVDPHLVLCDCPGLVFPSFVATKAHLVVNGILPIDELRDHNPPVSLVCEHIPRDVLEATYSIMIPRPSLDDLDPSRPPTSEELLTAYGGMRGFMTQRGVPDCPRASRYILKDYVKGKLLYCEPPPGLGGPEFQDHTRVAEMCQHKPVAKAPPAQIRSDVDKEFFDQRRSKANSKGVKGVADFVRSDPWQHTSQAAAPEGPGLTGGQSGSVSSLASGLSSASITAGAGKPWKKHNNRNKKEKLRRLHRDLDV